MRDQSREIGGGSSEIGVRAWETGWSDAAFHLRVVPDGSFNEGLDQGMRPGGEGGALGLKQRGDEKGMRGQFDHSHFTRRVGARTLQAGLDQQVGVLDRKSV